MKRRAFCVGFVTIALGAVGVATATASPPEFFECRQGSGSGKTQFTNKTCTVASPTGHYELVPGIGTKKQVFKGKIGAVDFYSSAGAVLAEVQCQSGTDFGHYATPTLLQEVHFKFSKCTFAGKKCSTVTTHKGIIETNALEAQLGFIQKSTNTVGADILPEGGTTVMEFSCEPEHFKVSGSVVGEITGDINLVSKDWNLIFTVNSSNHLQDPEMLEGHSQDVLVTEIGVVGPFNSALGATGAQIGENLELGT
jgi:hypothetical protein